MANRARNNPGTANSEIIDDGSKTLENLQERYEKNKKRINSIITVILVVVVGFFAYQKLYKTPNETKAAAAIYHATRYFESDSLDKALNGDGQHQGFLKIMKKYSGTPTANIAHYYAGICYLKKGNFNEAIKHLKDFDGKGTMVEYIAMGSLADAYMEKGDLKNGIEYYQKAAANKDDIAITPMYLYRLAVAYEMNNKPEEAKKAYRRIRDEYPASMQAREVEKNLARLGELE